VESGARDRPAHEAAVRSHPRRNRLAEHAGFGLLEAIVALALLTGAGVALLSWMHTSLVLLDRSGERETRARLLANAHAVVAGVDLGSQTGGREQVAGCDVQWSRELMEGSRTVQSGETEFVSKWAVDLVRLSVKAQTRHDGRPVEVTFEVIRAVPRLAGVTEKGAS
jgi:hypothetical protein